MSKFSILKNRFNLGQFSKRAFGLSNADVYGLGADTIKNMIPMSYGGVRRRGGSRYINTTDTHYEINANTGGFGTSNASSTYEEFCRLIEFKFKDSKGILYLDSDEIRFARWDWDAQTTQNKYDRTVPTGHTFGTLSNFISGLGGGTFNVDKVKYTQVGDFIYLVSGTGCPLMIGWDGQSTGTALIKNIFLNPTSSFTTDVQNRVPYIANTDTSHTLTNSGTTGTITLTSSDDLFDSDMENQTIFRFDSGTCIITNVASATSATAEVIDTFGGTSGSATWEESAWSDHRGWPTEIVFFEERLYYFRDEYIWASQSGDVSQMSEDQGTSVTATSPFTLTIGLEQNARICWANGSRSLSIGTEEAEYILTGPDSSASISATNVSLRKETEHGSFVGAPSIRVDNALYFVDRSGVNIREFVFDERENRYRTENISRFCIPDLIEDNFAALSGANSVEEERVQIIDMYRQVDVDNIIWFRTNTEALYSVTIDRRTATYGFAKHTLGGSLTGYDGPKVQAMCVSGDTVFMIVERTINSSTVRYLEAIPKQYVGILRSMTENSDNYETEEEFMWFVDAGTFKSGTGGNDITAHDDLAHLNGETIAFLGENQFSAGTATVVTDTATLSKGSYLDLIGGLQYESKLKLLPPNANSPYGSGEGLVRIIEKTMIRFYRTLAASVGIDTGETGFDDITFRTSDQALQDPIPLFNGLKRVDIPYTEEDHQLVIKTSKPLPMEVVAVTLKGQTYE